MTTEVIEEWQPTHEKMGDYYAGKGCKCAAMSENDCSCVEVDWTDPEVYKLRDKVKGLESEVDFLKQRNDLLSRGGE